MVKYYFVIVHVHTHSLNVRPGRRQYNKNWGVVNLDKIYKHRYFKEGKSIPVSEVPLSDIRNQSKNNEHLMYRIYERKIIKKNKTS